MDNTGIKHIKKGDKICCIGHITHDRVITPRFEIDMPGGTAYYFAKALRNLNHDNFHIVTGVAEDALNVIANLRKEGLDIEVVPSRNTVFFENAYGEDMNDRRQRVLAKADPFTKESLEGVDAEVFHLGTLLADDFSVDVIKNLSSRGIVSVDIQGYLREVEGEKVKAVDFDRKFDLLPYIDILKANEKEMETLTGTADPYESARIIAGWGAKEVLLTLGDRGSLIYSDGEFHEIPAYPVKAAVDATGCGDTYMAGYLYKRSRGASIDEAGRFAAAMCSIKLAQKGPFTGTEEEVEKVIASAL
ncbi:MAG: ribokinase [Muribaculaceae bacterium]|nr:ribokinase [Muribaculaceae bacterium]